MTRKKKITLTANLCIAVVLIGLGVAIFTADLTQVFISVGAPLKSGNGNNVSLMFQLENLKTGDDYTLQVAKLLRDNNVPATFFVGGKWASDNRDKVINLTQISLFELGNHAYNNRNLSKLKEKDQNAEIVGCHTMVKTITTGGFSSVITGGEDGGVDPNITETEPTPGVEMKLFLPPNGNFNKRTLRCAERNGYRTVIWSRNATESTNLYTDAGANLKGGELILLRPNLATYTFLTNAINTKLYEKAGVTLTTVSQSIGV
jgi:peptidoglycan/xylan/chitin deacetylase (PgdA/CDA1 family)